MSGASDRSPTASAKVDPESLVLRGAPRPVVRFKKRAIIALAALGSSALIGVTWMALKPVTTRMVATERSDGEQTATAPPDALAGAPASYAQVPRLGPPLPGDLGRAVLEHERSPGAPGAGSGAETGDAVAAEALRRRAAERKAARESEVIVRLARPATSERQNGAGTAPTPGDLPGGGDARLSGSARDAADAAAAPARNGAPQVSAHRLKTPVSPWILSAGSVIAASLITGLNSDLPGLVTAQVTQNVFDSATGRTLLIPQGSRLIGRYDAVVAYGQSRALVVWQRIILPDGSSLRLDDLPAADTSGHAGLADRVERHTWQLLKGVVLSSLLGVGAELGISGESELVRAVREATQQGGARAGDRLVAKSLDVQPTITVRPGWPLRVIVHQDLVLTPWRG